MSSRSSCRCNKTTTKIDESKQPNSNANAKPKEKEKNTRNIEVETKPTKQNKTKPPQKESVPPKPPQNNSQNINRNASQQRTVNRERKLKLQRLYDTPCSSISVLCDCKPPPNIADYLAGIKKADVDLDIHANFGRGSSMALEKQPKEKNRSCDSRTYASDAMSCSCGCEITGSSENVTSESESSEDSCCCNNNCCCCCCCCCSPCCGKPKKSKSKKRKSKKVEQKKPKKIRCNCAFTQTKGCICADGYTQTRQMKIRTAGCQCCTRRKAKNKKDGKKCKKKSCCRSKHPCCMRLVMCAPPRCCPCPCKGRGGKRRDEDEGNMLFCKSNKLFQKSYKSAFLNLAFLNFERKLQENNQRILIVLQIDFYAN